MKNVARRHSPAYRFKPPKPARSSGAGPKEWLAGTIGFGIGLLAILGLVWLVVSGYGQGRWVAPFGSPTPSGAPTTSRAPITPLPTINPRDANKTGTIGGRLGFPATTAPAQRVCAQSLTAANKTYCQDHPAGIDESYSIDVPIGTYYVYATLIAAQGNYSTSYRAYFNQFVLCQSSGSCSADLHKQYLPVTVTATTEISDINPTDWSAPQP